MTPRRASILVVAVVAAVAAVAGLYWFQPWRLVTDRTVNETLPSVVSPERSDPPPTTASQTPQNVLLATGTIVSHEQSSSGSAQLIRLADGAVQLALVELATSDGPDLHIWLTDQPVIEGTEGWHVFDDGRYVELGPLKANNGNQVYDVPAGTDLTGLTSVTIWCQRFAVSFGAAKLNSV
jgi:Electron transfer DM13